MDDGPLAGFEPAVNADDVELGDFFSDFADIDSFDLFYDEAAVIEEIPFRTVDMFEYHGFFQAVRAVFADVESELEFYPVGNPPLMAWVYEMLQQMIWLAVGMVLIFVFLLRTLFRSFSAVVWSILTIALSLVWTWGLTVWLPDRIPPLRFLLRFLLRRFTALPRSRLTATFPS